MFDGLLRSKANKALRGTEWVVVVVVQKRKKKRKKRTVGKRMKSKLSLSDSMGAGGPLSGFQGGGNGGGGGEDDSKAIAKVLWSFFSTPRLLKTNTDFAFGSCGLALGNHFFGWDFEKNARSQIV